MMREHLTARPRRSRLASWRSAGRGRPPAPCGSRNFALGGEECYYHLDGTPTASWCRALYKYPRREYPYAELVAANARRGRDEREYELLDTDVFAEGHWDVFVEYAKEGPDEVAIRLRIANRGEGRATIHVLPQCWVRNTWSWGCEHEGCWPKPAMRAAGARRVEVLHRSLGDYRVEFAAHPGLQRLLFCDNETDFRLLYGIENPTRYQKNGLHRFLVDGEADAVGAEAGTKVAAHHVLELDGGEEAALHLRLAPAAADLPDDVAAWVEDLCARRAAEADDFYAATIPEALDAEERRVARTAYAGLVWSRRCYHYVVGDWLRGDPEQPPPPPERLDGRNSDWGHLYARDVLLMPDAWEYPWFAAWDLAFHAVAYARIDPFEAQRELLLLLREWYLHPNGQLPAYEFAFGDVNPPVHAWACWRTYKIAAPRGARDRVFLARTFQKLLLNFTWWVNRKDPHGDNLFAGGFLGLDNIGVFDRSKELPGGGRLEQADGTAWMGFFAGTMCAIAMELASPVEDGGAPDPAYADMASKFFEHFAQIVDAMNAHDGAGLWDEADGFYFDRLRVGEETHVLRTHSLVGLVPLIAVEVLDEDRVDALPGFRKRLDWFLTYQRDLAAHVHHRPAPADAAADASAGGGRYLLAMVTEERLRRILTRLLDETEFLSPHGIRSLSRLHAERPFVFRAHGQELRVAYTPGESDTWLFGGNSNWRGPVWFPIAYLIVEALQKYHHFYGDAFTVECPTGSGNHLDLRQVATEIERRLASLFLPDPSDGRRPCHGESAAYVEDPAFRDLLLFHEYFHGDDGRGCGAAHQTGWTALVARCLEHIARARREGAHGAPER